MSGLGAWYANTLNVGYGRYLHYMSEKARLSVIIEQWFAADGTRRAA